MASVLAAEAMKTKVLFIGLDTAERDLLVRWSGSGKLPALRSLRDTGWTATAEVWPGFGPAALWPSLATGRSPATLGCYFDDQLQRGSYASAPFVFPADRAEPLWIPLSRAGKKSCVINVPYVSRAEEFDGVQVVDWGTHDHTNRQVHTWPPDLAAEIRREYGDDPQLGSCGEHAMGRIDDATFRDGLIDRVRKKAACAAGLLDRGGWDLFMVVLDEAHCIGERCWHLHDASHPAHDADLAASLGQPVELVYRAIDDAIAKLVARAGPDTTVIFTSVTGTRTNNSASWLLDDVLLTLEGKRSAGLARTSLLRRAWRAVPSQVRRRLSGRARGLLDTVKSREREHRTSFPLIHNNMSGAIRINVVGREPAGVIRRGAEYDACCDRLSAALRELRDLDTGEPVVDQIVRPRELFSGDNLDDLPDLLVVWAGHAPHLRVGSARLGEIEGIYPGDRSGDHTSHAILLASGPGIPVGSSDQPWSVLGIAPTLANRLGVTLPKAEGAALSLCA